MATLRNFLVLLITLLSFVGFLYAQFTADQKKQLVDKHNAGRKKQGAADMNEVKWDDPLAVEGQKLAETCKDGHVAVTVAGIKTVGQNLYWKSGTSDPVLAYDAWYEEIQAYKKDTNTCLPDRICGHYRMVVLNFITKVGCGFKKCSSFTKKDGKAIPDVTYVVCHYDSAPLSSGAVFTPGAPCTKCPSGKFWCNNDLCQPTCTAASDKCKCYAKYKGVCQNCGTEKADDCTCKCADGFLGTYCTDKCEDLPTGTNMKTSCTADIKDDPEFYCTDTGGKCCPYIRTRTCRATCAPHSKYCTPLTAAMKTAATTGCTLTKPTAPPSAAGGSSTTAAPLPDACKDYKCTNGKKLAEGSGCKCSCFTGWQGTACDVKAADGGASNTTAAPGATTTASAAVVCKGYTCANGKTSASGNKCKCTCNTNWQGDHCDQSVEEAKHGIMMTMKFEQKAWTSVYDGLKKAIPKAISSYCNKNFGACCPGMGARKNPSTTFDISSVAFMSVGKGFPQYVQTTAKVMIYVKYDANNKLCLDGTGAAGKRRRKRAATTFLPQDALHSAVSQNQATINTDMQACCKTGIDSVTKTKVLPSAGGGAGATDCPAGSGSGLQDWEIALIVLGVLLALFFIIILIYFCVRAGVCCCNNQKEANPTEMSENKVAPHGHSDVSVHSPAPVPNYDMYDDRTHYQVYM